MSRTFCKLALAASLAIGITGCDGGSSGTGISTTALGNVASVSTALRPGAHLSRPTMIARLLGWVGLEREALARGPLEDIRVTIEGTTLSTTTDAQGQFVVRGDFAGPVGMIFDPPDGGQARLVVDVPRGGEVTLTNVRVDGRTGQAMTESERLRFDGVVKGTDCPSNAATMVSGEAPADGNTYTVLLDGAVVHDQSGNPLACGNLSAGQSASVDGEVRSDGGVQAQSVEVEGESGHGGSTAGSGSSSGSVSGGSSGSGRDNGGGGEGKPTEGSGSSPSGDESGKPASTPKE